MLERKLLADQIADHLDDMIFQEAIPPGERLLEMQLAKTFGVSQAPVREALRILEERGLAVQHPGRGTFVVRLDDHDVADILTVRIPLEALVLTLARENSSAEGKRELLALFDALSRAAEDDDLISYHQAHTLFHRQLWKLSGNRHLEAALARICAPLWAFYRSKVRKTPGRSLSGARTHRVLVDYVLGQTAQDGIPLKLAEDHFADVAGFSPSRLLRA